VRAPLASPTTSRSWQDALIKHLAPPPPTTTSPPPPHPSQAASSSWAKQSKQKQCNNGRGVPSDADHAGVAQVDGSVVPAGLRAAQEAVVRAGAVDQPPRAAAPAGGGAARVGARAAGVGGRAGADGARVGGGRRRARGARAVGAGGPAPPPAGPRRAPAAPLDDGAAAGRPAPAGRPPRVLPRVAGGADAAPRRDARGAAQARRRPPRRRAAGAAAVGAGGVPPGVLRAGPLPPRGARRRLRRGHPRRRLRGRDGCRGRRLGRGLRRRVRRVRRVGGQRRAVPEDPDALLPRAHPRQPDVARDRPAPAAADRVVRGLVRRGGGGAEGGHGTGARARGVRRRRRVGVPGGVPRARERQSLPAQPAHAHVLTLTPSAHKNFLAGQTFLPS
jgi:hypothetical protein